MFCKFLLLCYFFCCSEPTFWGEQRSFKGGGGEATSEGATPCHCKRRLHYYDKHIGCTIISSEVLKAATILGGLFSTLIIGSIFHPLLYFWGGICRQLYAFF